MCQKLWRFPDLASACTPLKAPLTLVIDHHAVRHLAHLVSGEAASTMNQIQCETLESRTDNELAQLSADNVAIVIRAPRNWREWVDAFTNLFSPVNRIVLLARTVSNLQQGSSESVDSYGLRVTQAYARLLLSLIHI